VAREQPAKAVVRSVVMSAPAMTLECARFIAKIIPSRLDLPRAMSVPSSTF